MYAYKSKRSSYAKRKSTRRRTKVSRKRAGMRKKVYRKNTALVPSAEKKYFDYGITSQAFAQYNNFIAGTNGYSCTDQSIICNRGLGPNARIGNKVFMTGGILDIQMVAQPSVTNAIKYKWFVVRVPDSYDYPSVDIVTPMFDANPFTTGIFDWHSNLDPETASQFKIVAKGQGTLRPDSISGQTSRNQTRRYLKLGFPCKWDSDVLNAPPITNQLRLIMFADSGDNSTSTGILGSVNFRMFYLDN